MIKNIAISLSLCLLLAVPASSQVVINEFVYDDSGGDDRQFVELYNSGVGAVDISGWTIRGGVEFDFPDSMLWRRWPSLP